MKSARIAALTALTSGVFGFSLGVLFDGSPAGALVALGAATMAHLLQPRSKVHNTLQQFYHLQDDVLAKFDLTTQERQVARYLLRNYTYDEIACVLHVSESTVKFHTRNVYAKTGASTKRDLQRLVEAHMERLSSSLPTARL